MVDLTQPASAVVVQLINDANGTTFTPDQISLGTPLVNNQVLNGRNTIVSLTASGNPIAELGVDLTYNRLSLAKLLNTPYAQISVNRPSRLVDLLPAINSKNRLNLTALDIQDGPYRPKDIITGIQTVDITCQPGSLIYTGTVTVFIGDEYLIEEWFTRTHFRYSQDASSLTVQGGKLTLTDPQVLTPDNKTVAAYLGADRKVRTSQNYVQNQKPVAYFDNGILKEVVGPNGESSYSDQGVLKSNLPPLPAFMATIPEKVVLSAVENNNHLVYSTNYDIFAKKAADGTTYFVDGKNGDDNATGLTEATAFKSFNKALTAIPAGRIINVKGYEDYFYDIGNGWTTAIKDRALDIIGIETRPIFTGTIPLTGWVNQVGTVWYTSAPVFGSVVDLADNPVATGYGRLQSVNSISACQALTKSYFYDSVAKRLYVNLFNNRQPDASVLAISPAQIGLVTDGSEVYIENLVFDLTYSGFVADMTVPRTQGYLYSSLCDFGWTVTGPSFSSYGFNVIQYRSILQYGLNGGALYNSDRALPSMLTQPWVIELECTVQKCGVDYVKGNSPGSAATKGVRIFRMNGYYDSNAGNAVQETGDQTQSLNIGCHASNSKWNNAEASYYTVGSNSITQASAFYYSCTHDDNAVSFYPKGLGKVTLHDSPVGAKPCYQRDTPYSFAYSE